ncbi:S-adenosyl-L-methionine-dependent methyltransferase [Biscogniauxia mediterranea]|nr:S-adenosyl-L-methionine-dependent methyltransferase [Biscogniauxia mediterranea]
MDDTIETRIPPTCPEPVAQILRRAWDHDLAGLKPLLSQASGRASVQEPTTGETPLHAAIRGCAGQGDEERARAVVQELFLSGAIWNDVDSNGETPGCVAARLGLRALYAQCVDAGARAEMLFGLLDGYEELESSDGEEDEDEQDMEQAAAAAAAEDDAGVVNGAEEGAAPEGASAGAMDEDIEIVVDNTRAFQPPRPAGADDPDVKSEAYLRSDLTYSDGKLVDSSLNGVMMAWETSIMRASVAALLPDLAPGRRILNIGFGMGIIDSMFAETRPSRHHIVEAHPAVLEHINNAPECKFGKAWEASGPSEGAYKVHAGKWQDVMPKLLEQGETFDAIYFDTFGEDYGQLRTFFTEYVPALLEENGIFSFFNGLGADRQVCYDVYTKVVEMHLSDAGMDVDWQVLDVDMKGLEEEGKGEWQGVKRRYWTLDKYRLPICTLMG